jgi:hypothetical protein
VISDAGLTLLVLRECGPAADQGKVMQISNAATYTMTSRMQNLKNIIRWVWRMVKKQAAHRGQSMA